MDPPVPDVMYRLKNSTTEGVKEFGFAEYECVEGSAFVNTAGYNIINNKFQLECGLNGMYDGVINWPTCDIAECLEIDNLQGFVLQTQAPINVGDYAIYTCNITGQIVNNTDQPMQLRCMEDGTILYPPVLEQCRSRVACDETLTPQPDLNTTHLLEASGADLREFDYVEYSCKPGATLQGIPNANTFDIVDNKFRVQCLVGAVWDTVAAWPTCNVQFCTEVPILQQKAPVTTTPVAVGDQRLYTCSSTGFVMQGTGMHYGLTCDSTGYFTIPTNDQIVNCTQGSTCDTDPPPSMGTGLLDSTDTEVLEYSHAKYYCQEGSALTAGPSVSADGAFMLECESNNPPSWPASISWPNCNIAYCVNYPTLTLGDKVLVDPSEPDVPINTPAKYKCQISTQIIDSGKTLDLNCNDTTGQFDLITPEPACREAEACPDAPAGSDLDNTNLEKVTVEPFVKEFDYVTYQCKPGSNFQGVHSNVVGNTFTIMCNARTNVGPQYEDYGSLPVCTIEYCPTIPTILGFTAITSGNVLANDVASFSCETAGEVLDTSATLDITCDDSTGEFIIPSPLPTCRAAGICAAPPAPTPESNLQASTSIDVAEFGEAVYECNAGFSIDGILDNPNVRDGKFYVPCKQGAVFDAAGVITWPTCQPHKCETLPTLAGFETPNTAPIYVGGVAIFKCENNQVMDSGLYITATCESNGEFSVPDPLPTCRDSIPCTIPTPDPNTFLDPPAGPVNEYESADYVCQAGKFLDGMDGHTTFSVECGNGGTFTPSPVFPTCGVLTCTVAPVAGFTIDNTSPKPGETITFTCENPGEITDTGPTKTAVCNPDGTYTAPVGSCAAPNACADTNKPAPGAANLAASTSIITNEYDIATYECEADYHMVPGPGVNNMGKFELMCPFPRFSSLANLFKEVHDPAHSTSQLRTNPHGPIRHAFRRRDYQVHMYQCHEDARR